MIRRIGQIGRIGRIGLIAGVMVSAAGAFAQGGWGRNPGPDWDTFTAYTNTARLFGWGGTDNGPTATTGVNAQWLRLRKTTTITNVWGMTRGGSVTWDLISAHPTNASGNYTTIWTGGVHSTVGGTNVAVSCTVAAGYRLGIISTNVAAYTTNWCWSVEGVE